MVGYVGLKDLITSLERIPDREVRLSPQQQSIVEHGDGPLWVIAGPGSGKTEVLVLRCLKLLLVDRVPPKAIMITTFTEKAARNLLDRLTTYKLHLMKEHPEVEEVDLFQVRVGTLHSLCNKIMLEYRYPTYRNNRPLDDIEQLLFIYSHSELARAKPPDAELAFWKNFSFTLEGRGEWYLAKSWIPSRWIRAKATQSLFNRIVDDMIRIDKMIAKGGPWKRLAAAYMQYETSLDQNFRVDFAHMQSKFLSFLDSQLGERFLNGTGQAFEPGLKHVLVDEYQDTNPIQEAIYFKLAGPPPHNLVVVGDDDQALYRFRGGTVESLINFDRTCKLLWNLGLKPTPLVENYRSHPAIVDWCNNYIDSFDLMKSPGARVPGKPSLVSRSSMACSWHNQGEQD
jgi:DNA helicase-2/ATP-dependent DNA helicase PcrA